TALLLALTVSFLALLLATDGGVRAWDGDDDADEVEEEDDDAFDFMSSTRDDIVEVECDGQECATEGGATAFDPREGVPSVWTRGLVTSKPKARSIVQEHARAATKKEKRFSGETLGYVTPWNNRGYDWAKLFRSKFTYISPVWLQVREDVEKVPLITGVHDIDRQWVLDVKHGVEGEEESGGEGPMMVPRVVYERNRLSSEDVPVIVAKLLVLVAEHGFDGVVFEIPVMAGTMDMLLQMGRAFQAAKKLLILVLSRGSNEGELPVTHEMFAELAEVVHRFSMNAYDFATPGPNAPYPWLQATLEKMSPLEREKMLVGLPFYGYDNSGACECQHVYTAASTGSHHVVFYPCLQFLHDRLELYQEYGVGVAVWELGQGM
ncbi:hypothetical protein BBJ28_00011733, partial [Nothophytophthora sp. Chile5]